MKKKHLLTVALAALVITTTGCVNVDGGLTSPIPEEETADIIVNAAADEPAPCNGPNDIVDTHFSLGNIEVIDDGDGHGRLVYTAYARQWTSDPSSHEISLGFRITGNVHGKYYSKPFTIDEEATSATFSSSQCVSDFGPVQLRLEIPVWNPTYLGEPPPEGFFSVDIFPQAFVDGRAWSLGLREDSWGDRRSLRKVKTHVPRWWIVDPPRPGCHNDICVCTW